MGRNDEQQDVTIFNGRLVYSRHLDWLYERLHKNGHENFPVVVIRFTFGCQIKVQVLCSVKLGQMITCKTIHVDCVPDSLVI